MRPASVVGQVGDKQVTAANDERKQNIEQCKPVPPTDHLGDFFTVALTMSYHNLLSVIFLSALCLSLIEDCKARAKELAIAWRWAGAMVLIRLVTMLPNTIRER